MATKPKPNQQKRLPLGVAIKRMRRRAEMTQEAAADAFGAAVGSWRRYEWGERGLDLDKLEKIARALGGTLEELLAEEKRVRESAGLPTVGEPLAGGRSAPRPTLAGGSATLPLRDRLQAGAWLAVHDDPREPRLYPAARDPRFGEADQWLSEVLDDSMEDLRILEGDLVQVVDAEAIGYAPKSGDLVVVERTRFEGAEREVSMRQVEVHSPGVFLFSRSPKPRWAEPLALPQEPGAATTLAIRGLVLASLRRF